MAERKIEPTYGIEAFINDEKSITLLQNEWVTGNENIVVIELRDVDTICQWLVELRNEAMTMTAGK